MRRGFIAVGAVLLALLAWPLSGSAALSCGLPEVRTTWIEFTDGAVPFWRDRFGRPGVVIATVGPVLGAEARSLGAGTIHWESNLKNRVGTLTSPADAAVIVPRADAVFDRAVEVTGCSAPMIALNELWSASMPPPLPAAVEQYRANVLRFVTRLSERGARPALLVPGRPFTESDAAGWWKSLAAVSDLVLENYANANYIWRDGPVDGSRRLRTRYRDAATQMLGLGIPATRLGTMIGFQTGLGTGGREGLKPRSRWFDVAKWQALAVQEVARELKLSHVWSWGWAQRDERSTDPDKTYAACVWLWSRDPGLCDAPSLLGHEFDADRRAGQLTLPAGTRCTYGSTRIDSSSVAALAKLTRDREVALTALVVRAAAGVRVRVPPTTSAAFERRIVGVRFGGDGGAYRSALAEVGASTAIARGIVADEVRAREVLGRLSVASPAPVELARFRETYAPVLARRIAVSPAPSWLPEGEGVALATSAPEIVFRLPTGRTRTIDTVEGRLTIELLEDTTALGALPFEIARTAIVRELRATRRAAAYTDWIVRVQRAAWSRLVCERDRMPELGFVALSDYVPFLSLHEGPASLWASSRRP